MPFRTNCPSCGKDMLLRETMYGKPKRCQHCDKIFRVGGGPIPSEAELAAFEAQAAGVPAAVGAAAKPKASKVRIVVEERVADVIPVVEDRRERPLRRDLDPPRRAKSGAPLWLVLLSIGGLVVGLGVAGFFVWKATSERDTSSRTNEAKKKTDDVVDDSGKPDERKPIATGPAVTRENLNRLRRGMPQNEALALLGSPSAIVEIGEQAARLAARGAPIDKSNYLRQFIWRSGIDYIEIGFILNQVESFRGKIGGYEVVTGRVLRDDVVRPNPQPQPTMPKLTVEKFRLIMLGTSEGEVVRILGLGPSSTSNLPGQPDPLRPTRTLAARALTWVDGADSIQLVFVARKLVSGNAFLGGKVIPIGG